MQQSEVMEQVKRYIIDQVLDGNDIGLEETTPLLEWGIINSIEIVRLLSFIRRNFEVDIRADKITADHFTSLVSIVDVVLETADATRSSSIQ